MKKKVIIIGGGIAGLASGVYAQLNGYEVFDLMPDVFGVDGKCCFYPVTQITDHPVGRREEIKLITIVTKYENTRVFQVFINDAGDFNIFT